MLEVLVQGLQLQARVDGAGLAHLLLLALGHHPVAGHARRICGEAGASVSSLIRDSTGAKIYDRRGKDSKYIYAHQQPGSLVRTKIKAL